MTCSLKTRTDVVPRCYERLGQRPSVPERSRRLTLVILLLCGFSGQAEAANDELFHKQVAPLLQRACLKCHSGDDPKGGLSLTSAELIAKGGESGRALVPGKPEASLLLDSVSGPMPEMPKNGSPLTPAEIGVLRQWIAEGAAWPAGVHLAPPHLANTDWWSLKPIAKPAVPGAEGGNFVDAFVEQALREKGLTPLPAADRRTLFRRLVFDLTGLPPLPAEMEAFINDADPQAYEKLVDRLLASPRFGERWARHWLDAVHYGETHGFDKDKLRPHAWPYRDYVIRAFNSDKPYAQFVEEQLAGDALYPHTTDGIVALGFLAAGPFNWVGHVEVGEGTLEGQSVRSLDRDDMVRTALETFTSTTVGCARCHDHKFDPITQRDYYRLQAVFAAVDRANRPYEADSGVGERRTQLVATQAACEQEKAQLEGLARQQAGAPLQALEAQLARSAAAPLGERPEFGYHSQIEPKADVEKWVQIDLGQPTPLERLVLVGCHDLFNNIGAGFGFPVRYKIELCDSAEFAEKVTLLVAHTEADVPNPGVVPQEVAVGKTARYIRITCSRLAPRQNDYIFALGEVMAFTPEGENAAAGAAVAALDSIEAPVRWRRTNLTDGYYYGVAQPAAGEVAVWKQKRDQLLAASLSEPQRLRLAALEKELAGARSELSGLPAPGMVFAAATHFQAEGNHVPRGGVPREIAVLRRGDVKNPGEKVGPGALACLGELPSQFEGPALENESQRRAALARWITDRRNPLTWRSIVNRVWLHHFGRGLVDSPNDFGRMGSLPSHPELLDFLAVWFRDEAHGSLKQLHRLIVTSAAYRRAASAAPGEGVESFRANLGRDAANVYLWRQNRRKLEAEALRDSMLAVAGKLDFTAGGPGFRAFAFKDDHSPHYLYEQFDPDDPASHRRAIYRFIVRSAPDPFLESLDCADPSLIVEKRNETLTALQALALLNNKFVIRMSEHFAARVAAEATPPGNVPAQVERAFVLSLGRAPEPDERETLVHMGRERGLPAVCRILFNLNEFMFVD